MKRLLVLVLIAALFACTSAPPVHVSTKPGPSSIQGKVVDSSGAPLPGVTITATDAQGGKRSAVTDANGRYALLGLASGRYTVTGELYGLMKASRIVDVPANNVATAELTLHLGAVAETITVTAQAPAPPPGTFTVMASHTGGNASKATRDFAPIAPPPASFAYAPEAKVENRPQYAAFEDHGFVDTGKERVTTFAIDVDRASYANIRRFLSNGTLPPRDAVRIEEMVNYFSYDLPQPTGADPFSITAEVSAAPWNPANRLLRIGIQGRNLEQWKMAPNNLVFLLDISGSMSPPNRLPLIKQAFRVLVDQLRAEDRVAIVVYAGAQGLALPSTSGADKQRILAALDNLQSGGSTAGAAGIELAYDVAKQNFLKNGNNRVILATDGDFNVGISSIPELQALIEKKRESGIFLSTVGVGDDNYQDALMEMLADKGNGNYAYLDSLKEAEKVFRSELTGTLVTIAKDVKVQLTFDPARVQSYRQIGYENRALANQDFEDDTKDAGELGAGHSVTALYEIVPRGDSRGTIATIDLRYKEPGGEVSKLVKASATDTGTSAYEASADMQFAAAVAELGMLLRNSPHKGSASWDDVAQLLRLARGADLDGMRGELATLVESARLLVAPDRMAIAK